MYIKDPLLTRPQAAILLSSEPRAASEFIILPFGMQGYWVKGKGLKIARRWHSSLANIPIFPHQGACWQATLFVSGWFKLMVDRCTNRQMQSNRAVWEQWICLFLEVKGWRWEGYLFYKLQGSVVQDVHYPTGCAYWFWAIFVWYFYLVWDTYKINVFKFVSCCE